DFRRDVPGREACAAELARRGADRARRRPRRAQALGGAKPAPLPVPGEDQRDRAGAEPGDGVVGAARQDDRYARSEHNAGHLRIRQIDELLGEHVPASRSGTTRMSAWPATADTIPLVRAASSETAVSKASGPS